MLFTCSAAWEDNLHGLGFIVFAEHVNSNLPLKLYIQVHRLLWLHTYICATNLLSIGRQVASKVRTALKPFLVDPKV